MKFVALLSGGKDSVFNALECVSLGHELVCVANLYPQQKENEN
jgi:diphthine-ammonia ligase